MKNRRIRLEPYSFFNHTGIAAHLEQMAEKGWMLTKIANYGWVYHRVEPAKLRFAVSYFPKASEFDPEPTEEQRRFLDFCEYSGWELVCSSAQMQIFCNRRENPVPIETEPMLELSAIHASAKKSFLPAYFALLAISLLNGAMYISKLLGDPLELLASPSQLFTGFGFLILLLFAVWELLAYFRWHRRAKQAAERGEFLPSVDTSRFQKAVLALVLILFIWWAVNYFITGTKLHRWVAVLMFGYTPAVFLIVQGVKDLLKKKKASRGVNRTVTIVSSFVAAFAIMGGITFGLLTASNRGLFAEKDEETYEHRGSIFVVHQDELPLTVEDLVEIDYDGYIKERRGDASLLLGQFTMHQWPRLDAEDYPRIPHLEYTLIWVRLPILYDFCKNRMIYEAEELRPVADKEYRPQDAASWGAEEVYRLYDLDYGPTNTWLLCFADRLVEIDFDWEPTAEQMAIAGARLSGKG